MKTPKKFALILRVFIPLLGLIISITGCKKINNTEQVDLSYLNVINASPGNVSINFFLNNGFVNGPALYYTERTGYIQTYGGVQKFDATVGGSTSVLATSQINLASNKYHSLFFAGLNQSPVIVFTQDDLFDPPAGKAKIRFIQLSPDAPALDLVIKAGPALFAGKSFKSISDFINIDPAVYTFQLKSGTSASLAEILNVPIDAGKIYTVWAGGSVSASGPTALSIQVMANK
jgi:hypothetical protein